MVYICLESIHYHMLVLLLTVCSVCFVHPVVCRTPFIVIIHVCFALCGILIQLFNILYFLSDR